MQAKLLVSKYPVLHTHEPDAILRVGSQEVHAVGTDEQVRQMDAQFAPEHIAAPISIKPTSQGQEFEAKILEMEQEVQLVLVPSHVRHVYEQGLHTALPTS